MFFSIIKKRIKDLAVTENMKNKMIYYFENPTKLPKVDNLKKELLSVMGIGNALANKLIKMGLTKKSQLGKYEHLLSEQTKMFLKLKPLKKIPNAFIKKIKPTIINLGAGHGAELIIVGSFRRNTNYSSDIDVMVVSNKKNILKKLISDLRSHAKVFPYIIGDDKISTIIKINGKTVKLDFFRTPKKEKWAMLLYSTGSKYFNIKMRNKAKKMGMLLNQNGLYKNGKKISKSANSEKFFFDALDMKYVNPANRL